MNLIELSQNVLYWVFRIFPNTNQNWMYRLFFIFFWAFLLDIYFNSLKYIKNTRLITNSYKLQFLFFYNF
jgi:hypothetical protein